MSNWIEICKYCFQKFIFFFFHRMLIKDHLTKLLTRPELSSQHLLTGEKPYFNKKQLLAFCLYFIERDYHFSGNGIWYRHTYKQEYLPDT